MKKLLLLFLIFVVPVLQSACFVQASDANTTNTRKMLLAFSDAAHYTRLALNTNMMLARTNVIAPERALVFNESLRKFNAAQKKFETFLDSPGVLAFDEQGKATLTMTVIQRGEAQGLLDAVAAAAADVLGDELLGGSAKLSQQYRPLIIALKDLSKRIATALSSIKQAAQLPTITVPLLLDRQQWESLKGA